MTVLSMRSVLATLVILLAVPLAGCQTMKESADLVLETSRMDQPTDALTGKAQFREGNYGLAEEAFRRAVESDPGDAESWLGLGATHDKLRRFDLSDRDYAQVERLSGRTAALLNNRGFSYLLRGNFAKARADLSAAHALDPGNPDIESNLAAAIRGRRI
ncbi:MAG: Tetratricopeptide 2 [Hyphomicrobiales bacterium]|jgi:Flp pilus assembly protein TadD|nr:Tetratricopeptide 2 [Hyphomicrobiales bacterium]